VPFKEIPGLVYKTDDSLRSADWLQMYKDYQKENMKREDVKGFYWANIVRMRAGEPLVK